MISATPTVRPTDKKTNKVITITGPKKVRTSPARLPNGFEIKRNKPQTNLAILLLKRLAPIRAYKMVRKISSNTSSKIMAPNACCSQQSVSLPSIVNQIKLTSEPMVTNQESFEFFYNSVLSNFQY